MPTYVQIQTYATCGRRTLRDVLRRYQEVLTRLGCEDAQVLDWFSHISWPVSDDDPFGDIYAAPVTLVPAHNERIDCAGIEVSLYPQPALPSVEELPSWLGFSLLFDVAELKANIVEPYEPEVGYVLWHILCELAMEFSEAGTYFTDEWQENRSWRAVVENVGDPWAFDLGLFPRRLASHFVTVPAGYKGTVLDGAFGFAQANRWQVLPWTQDEQR